MFFTEERPNWIYRLIFRSGFVAAALDLTDPPPLNWSTLRYVFGQERRTVMPRKRPTPEEIVAKLRQVDVLVSQGKSVADAVRSIGTTEVSYYR